MVVYNIFIKRFIDVILSFSALVFLFPILVLVAITIRIKLSKSIFFCQVRPGKNDELFEMVKFRSMTEAVDKNGITLSDDFRLTSFGSKLRSSSLDELPELWNVLKGDMSLVGPRPLLVEYLPLYSREQAKRHNVRPGITGWAQINGRNAISWEEKFKLDVWYVENQSFWLDMKILALTAKKVFIKEGITQEGKVTMSKFTGKKQ